MINLKKGATISLEKDNGRLDVIYIGLNWGKIQKYWGLVSDNVDLDGIVTCFDKEGNDLETIYYHKRLSEDGAIRHSGDDVEGDSSVDEKDNEVISIRLSKVSEEIQSIFVYLNSYKGHDFDTIPYAKIRLLDGDALKAKNTFASFNLESDPKCKGKVSMVLARIDRKPNGWRFSAIGEPADSKKILSKKSNTFIFRKYLPFKN